MVALRLIFLLLLVTVLTEAQTVYITKTGSKYHTSGCRYLSRSKIPISLEDAIRRYSPCSVCRPPTSVIPKTTARPAEQMTSTSSSTTAKISTSVSETASTSLSGVNSVDANRTRIAYITSVVDGTDIIEVNLWDHRTIVTTCRNNEKVTVLVKDETYIKLRTEDGKEGWCMRLFIKKE